MNTQPFALRSGTFVEQWVGELFSDYNSNLYYLSFLVSIHL